MGNRRIILFLLTAIAACSLLLWALHQRQRDFAVQEKARPNLIDEALGRVVRLTIDRGDTRIGLALTGDRWHLTAPFSAQIEQGTVARVLDAFETTRIHDALAFHELRKRELSLREFGLAPARIHVMLEGSQQRQEILLGAFTPLGNELYVRVNGTDHILVVPAALHDAIPRTADDLRSRKLVYGPRGAVRTLEIRAPGSPFITLAKESGTWRLVQPAAAPADDDKVNALLDTLYEARLSHFVWPTVSNVMDVAETETALKTRMGVYGLGIDYGVHISVQESSGAPPAKLIFGHTLDSAAALCYALLPDGGTIGAVSNSVAEAFRLTVGSLRDPRPFYGPAAGVRRLQIHLADTLFVLTQTNGLWRFEAPVADAADQTAVRETVERLLRLKADAIFENGTEPAADMLERALPLSHVEVASDQGAWRFLIQPGDLENAVYHLVFTNAPTVFQIASSNLPPALVNMAGVFSLRDKSVLALPRASLRRITVKRDDAPAVVTVERDSGEALWHLGEGSSGRIAEAPLHALTAGLEDLRADRIEGVGLTAERLAAYGLSAPWLEISIDVDAQDAVRKTLLVGRDAGFGKRYAAIRGLDVLFVLDRAALEILSTRFVEPITP